MIQLPNNEKCYNLPEQVAQNLLNIKYLAEQYANIDALPDIWAAYKREFDSEIETFGDWTTTFEGWDTTLSTYLVNMSSAAVGAIAGQNIAPANVAATGAITAPSIIETNTGYAFSQSWAGLVLTYVGVVKTGNKVTFAIAGEFDGETGVEAYGTRTIGSFSIPEAVGSKLYPDGDGRLAYIKTITFTSIYSNAEIVVYIAKNNDTNISFYFATVAAIAADYAGKFRVEATFLLSDPLN